MTKFLVKNETVEFRNKHIFIVLVISPQEHPALCPVKTHKEFIGLRENYLAEHLFVHLYFFKPLSARKISGRIRELFLLSHPRLSATAHDGFFLRSLKEPFVG